MKSPFKFLDAYDAGDTAQFFGRDAEIETLYEKVFESNLVLVYGASGTGKTSLIQCGLRKKFAPTDWLPILIRRRTVITQSLLSAVRRYQKTPVPEESPIQQQIRSVYLDHYKPIYFIFDQFEELFILGKNTNEQNEEAEAFFTLLKDLLTIQVECKFLLVIREEYIAHLSDYENIIPTLFDNRIRIELMNQARIKDVISGTLNYHKIELEQADKNLPMLISKLRKHNRDGIPLTTIQLLLDRLWDAVVKKGNTEKITFTSELISAIQMEDVMGDYLENQVKMIETELGPGKSGVPLDILYALVSDDGTKRSLDVAEIQRLLPADRVISEADLSHCIKRFEELRILKSIEL